MELLTFTKNVPLSYHSKFFREKNMPVHTFTHPILPHMKYIYEGCSINTWPIAINKKRVGSSYENIYVFLLKN